MGKTTTPIKQDSIIKPTIPQAPKKKKNKKKSFKKLMKSIMKSSLTEEQRVQKQKDKLDKQLVAVNFKKVDTI